MINVADFGVRPDLGPDQFMDVPLQALIADQSANEIDLYFPRGQYFFGSTVTLPGKRVVIHGDGYSPGFRSGTVLVGDFAGDLFRYEGDKSCRVDGISFENKSAAGTAFALGRSMQSSFDRCSFKAPGFGLVAGQDDDNTFALTMRDCEFRQCGVGAAINSHMLIENCQFVNNGVGLYASGGVVKIHGCRSEVNGIGWSLGTGADGAKRFISYVDVGACSFEANDTALVSHNLTFGNIKSLHIYGSTNAPSGSSRIGIDVMNQNMTTWENIRFDGGYETACVQFNPKVNNNTGRPCKWSRIDAKNNLGGVEQPDKRWLNRALAEAGGTLFEQAD